MHEIEINFQLSRHSPSVRRHSKVVNEKEDEGTVHIRETVFRRTERRHAAGEHAKSPAGAHHAVAKGDADQGTSLDATTADC